MLTIFSTCKPFVNEFELIQKNAITSWKKLDKNIEVIIFGDEKGVKRFCNHLSIKNIKNIERHNNLPILQEIFYKAQKIAKWDVLCYSNADIIFARGLLETITVVKKIFKVFLITGTRIDINIDYQINFNSSSWQDELIKIVKEKGRLHQSNRAFDFFVFPRGLFYNLPPFVIGRIGWDNHFFAKMIKKRIPIFDATDAIIAIHQEHSYSTGGGYEKVWYGPESQYNLNFLQQTDIEYSLFDTLFKVKYTDGKKYKIVPNYLGIKRYLTRTLPHLKYFFRGVLK